MARKINIDKCNNCGFCIDECPVGAVGCEVNNLGYCVYTIDQKQCVDCGTCDWCNAIEEVEKPSPEEEFRNKLEEANNTIKFLEEENSNIRKEIAALKKELEACKIVISVM